MIDIAWNPNKMELTLDGHANYAEAGKDIVCSAVSTLVCTLDAYLSDNAIEYDRRLKYGDGYIRIYPTIDEEEPLNYVMITITTGLTMIAENYPEYVSFCVVD